LVAHVSMPSSPLGPAHVTLRTLHNFIREITIVAYISLQAVPTKSGPAQDLSRAQILQQIINFFL